MDVSALLNNTHFNLTLTSVVFEYSSNKYIDEKVDYLTLTSVVFEYQARCKRRWKNINLTLTSVVFEWCYEIKTSKSDF